MFTAPAGFALTKTWTNPLGGNWNVPGNWSGGTVPVAGDDVIINGPGALTVMLNVSPPALNSLTLGDSVPDGIQTLQITTTAFSLTLNGASTIHPDGRFVMDMGTLTGTGTLNVAAGAEITLGSANTKTLTIAAISNFGTIQWTGGQINTSALSLTNQPGGLFDIQGTGGVFAIGGTAPVISNSGTLRKSTGAGASSVNIRFNNSAVVEVQTGTLNFSGGGAHSGSFTGTAPGATLQFGGGTHAVNAGSTISGFSAVNFGPSGTVTVAGSIDVTGGATSVSGANLTLNGTVVSLGDSLSVSAGNLALTVPVTSFVDSISISGGVVNLNNGATYTIDTLSLSNGTLDGSTSLTMTGATTWSGNAILAGPGKLTVSGGLTISGLTKTWRGKTIDNPATTTWIGGQINSGSGATFHNLAGGTFDIQTDALYGFNLGGTPVGRFVNDGTVVKSAGPGTTTLDLAVDNNNAIQVQTGTLHLAEGGVHTGSFTGTAPGTTLQFGGGTHVVTASSSISGFSTVHFDSGTVNIPGSINVTGGTTSVSGATVTLNGTVASLGNSLTVSAGTLNLTVPVTSFVSNVSISNGIANLNNGASYTINTLSLSNSGTLDGSTSLTMTGATTWSGNAVLAGAGKLTVGGGLTISGSTKTWRGKTIDNPATTTWTGGQINSGSGATFHNLASGTFDIKTDALFSFNLGGTPPSRFINDGTIVKSLGAGTSTLDLALDNNNAIQVQTGTLHLAEGGAHTGSFTGTAPGTTLQFGGGTHTVNAGSSISGFSTVHFDTGTVNVPGSIDITGGTTSVSGATVTLNGTIASLGNALTVSGGTLNLTAPVTSFVSNVSISNGIANLNNGASYTINTLSLSNSGTLDGSTSLTVTGASTWSGNAILAGPGKLTVSGGLTISGSTKSWRGKTIDNTATTTWTGGQINSGSGAAFRNLAGATFDIKTDSLFSFNLGGTPASLFVNEGTIVKSAGLGTATLDVFIENKNAIQVQTGTLKVSGGGAHTGSFAGTAAGTTLQFGGGTHALQAASSISGFSTVHFDQGIVDAAGTITVVGTTSVTGATANLNGTVISLGNALTVSGGALNLTVPVTTFVNTISISNGVANLNNGASYTIDTLTLTNSGTLDGSTSLTMTGATTWAGSGILAGSGKLIVNGGLTISGSTKTWRGKLIENPATTTWTGGQINSGSGATFHNLGGGTFDIKADAFYSFNLGGTTPSRFVNDGTIVKTAGAGTTTLDLHVDNNNAIQVQTGILNLSEGGAYIGSLTGTAPGTTLQFGGGTHVLATTSSISGFSTLHFDGGTVNVAGSINVAAAGATQFTGSTAALTGSIASLGNSVSITNGTANINNGGSLTTGTLTLSNGLLTGSTALTVTGLTTWNSGNLEGTGKLTVAGGMNIATNGGKIWRARPIENPATTTWTGATVNLGDGATFKNLAGATFDIRTDQFFIANLGGTTASFVNDGAIVKSAGAGIATMTLIVDNNGSVQVQTGTLTFGSNSVHGGAITGATGTTLRFITGTHDVNPGSSISGFSTLHFDSGTVDVAGSIDLTGGATQVTGATANLTGPIASLGNSVSITNGTANINNGGNLTIGTLTLSSGFLTGSTALTVTGLTTWNGGTIDGTGKLTVSGGMNIATTNFKSWRTRVIDNPATVVWTGASTISTGLGATLNNLAGGTFDVQTDQFLAFNFGGATSAFNNAGTFKKSVGGGTSTIDFRFTNTGTVEALVGRIDFTEGFVQTAGTTRLNGGTINTTVAPGLDIQGGVLTGTGTILGNVRNGGELNAGQSPGRLNIGGSYTQTATGVLNAEIAGPTAGSQHDQIAVGGATSLDGTLNATNISPFEPNEDDFFTIMTYASVTGDFAVKNLNYGPGRNYIATRNPTNYTLTAAVVEADISLSKTGPASAPAGSTITYTLNVTNIGPDASGGIIVRDTLDPRVTFVSANTTGYWSCSHASRIVTCTGTADLAAATTSENIVIDVTAPASGAVFNSAAVTASIFDPNNANNTAGPVRTDIDPVANLNINKTDAVDPVNANAEISYTLSVSNSGPSVAAPTTVTDTLPAGVTFVSASGSGWSCTYSDPIVTCTASSIGVGTAAPITIKVTAPAEGGTITNTATVTSPADQTPSSDSETTTVLAADLALSKTAPSNIPAGSSIDYVITVQNFGPSTATGVTVTDTLDPNVTFVSANNTGFWNCAHSSSIVTCTATADLTVGTAPENISIVVTAPTEPMTVTNSASVTSSIPDPSSSNNSSGAISTTVTAQADVSISKSASPEPVAADQSLTFTINVSNGGPSTAANVVVTDVIDPRYTFVSADGGDWSCQFDPATATVTCDRPSLAVGAAPAIEIDVRTPFEPAVIPNTATVSSATSDPDSSDTSSTIETTVTAAIDLSITKSDSPDPVILGTTLTYTIVVTNAGPSAATNATLEDVLPSSVTFISATSTQGTCSHSGGTVNCSLGSIARLGSSTITIEVRPDALGVISNTATVTAPETDTNTANNSATEATSVGALRADLSITKRDTPDPVDAGAELTYTIQVTNLGPDPAASVEVTDVLPPGATLMSAGGTGWTCNGTAVVSCTLTTLAVGPATPLTIVVTFASDGTVTNTASVTSTTTDPNPDNNSAVETTMVLPADADLFVIKTANPARVNVGAELTYEVTVGNHGPALATNVVMTDTLPGDVDFVSAEPSTGTCFGTSTVTCDLGSIARDGIATVIIRVRTRSAGLLLNTASARADEDDPELANNTDSVTTIVDPPGNVSITKSGPSTVTAGGEAAYVIQVINDSGTSLVDVVVRDNFPAHLSQKRWTCSATVGSSCGKSSGSGNINIRVDLAPGGVVTFEATARVVPGACGSITNAATIQLPVGAVDTNLENNTSSTTATVLCRGDS